MISGAPRNENNERGFIVDRGDMTEEELMEASRKRKERKKLRNN